MERTIMPKKSVLKRELECYVIAWNTCLREVVKSMDVITLLRNAHPSYRPNFAVSCVDVKLLTKEEAREFVKIP